MKKAADDLPLFAREAPRFFTISELNQIIKGTSSRSWTDYGCGESLIFGPPSGHYYFTLKDDKSQILAVMFRRQGLGLSFARKRHGGPVLRQSQSLPSAWRFAAVC
jgi:exonuclease VII large subunit